MKSLKIIAFVVSLLCQTSALLAAGSGAGTVQESFQAGGYTYLRVDEQGQETWLATSPSTISKGDAVEYSDGFVMTDFYSKALDRTFDYIVFVDQVKQPGDVDENDIPGNAMSAGGQNPHGITGAAAVSAPVAGEIPAIGGGKTVAEIFANRQQLEAKEVMLSAKVMKTSNNILGKNWITLRDGTGTEPENALMATSLEFATPGDVVIAKGIIHNDIDIGSGYKYKVLLEDVTFLKSAKSTP